MSITGHAPDNLPRGDWRDHAACRVLADPEVMFPPPGAPALVARSICDDCPVRRACANWALSNPQDAAFGVWGGLTERERATILRRRVPRDPDHPQAPRKGGRPQAECGTASAYDRHVKKREPIDDACRAAKRRRDAAHRAKAEAAA